MDTLNTRSRSAAWNIIKMILAALLVVYIFSKTNLDSLRSTFQNVSVYWLVVMVFVFLGMTFLKALQYYVLTDGFINYWQILNVVVLQNVVSNFLATGAGIASMIASLRVEHNMKLGRSMTMFLLTKVGDLGSIWLVLIVSSMLVWKSVGVLHLMVIMLIIAIGAVLAVFTLTVIYRQRTVQIIRSALVRMKLDSISIVSKGLGLLQSLAEIETRDVTGKLLAMVAVSVIYMVGTIFSLYANLRVFGVEIDALGIVFATSLLQLVSYFPIQVFGGLGVSETSTLYFLSFFNVSQDILAPALIGVRVVFYFLNLIPLLYLPIYTAFLTEKAKP
jgi:uncharacterized membrane protein YbhN (UPF0104 family)